MNSHRRTGSLTAGLAAVVLAGVLGLALAPAVAADVGVAAFHPTSTAAGSSVRVTLVGCTYPADQVRIALARAGRADADRATDVPVSDAGAAGEYVIEVPGDLAEGEYVVYAACPRDATFGFWGSEQNLMILPDTSTPGGVTGSATYRWSVLLVAAIVGLGAGLLRAAAGGRRHTC